MSNDELLSARILYPAFTPYFINNHTIWGNGSNRSVRLFVNQTNNTPFRIEVRRFQPWSFSIPVQTDVISLCGNDNPHYTVTSPTGYWAFEIRYINYEGDVSLSSNRRNINVL